MRILLCLLIAIAGNIIAQPRISYLTPDDVAAVVIKGPNFSADWDGRSPAELDLAPGRYKANVEIGSEKYKFVTFEVSKKSCEFEFVAASGGEWKGKCK